MAVRTEKQRQQQRLRFALGSVKGLRGFIVGTLQRVKACPEIYKPSIGKFEEACQEFYRALESMEDTVRYDWSCVKKKNEVEREKAKVLKRHQKK